MGTRGRWRGSGPSRRGRGGGLGVRGASVRAAEQYGELGHVGQRPPQPVQGDGRRIDPPAGGPGVGVQFGRVGGDHGEVPFGDRQPDRVPVHQQQAAVTPDQVAGVRLSVGDHRRVPGTCPASRSNSASRSRTAPPYSLSSAAASAGERSLAGRSGAGPPAGRAGGCPGRRRAWSPAGSGRAGPRAGSAPGHVRLGSARPPNRPGSPGCQGRGSPRSVPSPPRDRRRVTVPEPPRTPAPRARAAPPRSPSPAAAPRARAPCPPDPTPWRTSAARRRPAPTSGRSPNPTGAYVTCSASTPNARSAVTRSAAPKPSGRSSTGPR